MRKILIVGGGQGQGSLIRAACAAGHYVHILDTRQSAQCLRLGDSYTVATAQNDYSWVREIEFADFDLVTTAQSDFAALWACDIAEKLNIPLSRFIKPPVPKYRQREMWNREFPEVSVPYLVPSSPREAVNWIKRSAVTHIIKPGMGQGSIGVDIIKTTESVREIELKFDKAKEKSFDGSVLIEQYIAGEEISFDSFELDSGGLPLAFCRKCPFDENPNLDQLLTCFPFPQISAGSLTLASIQSTIARSLGFTNVFVHAEYRFLNGRYTLIEMSPRGGGGGISDFVIPRFVGKSQQRLLFDFGDIDPLHFLGRIRRESTIIMYFPKNVKNFVELELKSSQGFSPISIPNYRSDLTYSNMDALSRPECVIIEAGKENYDDLILYLLECDAKS